MEWRSERKKSLGLSGLRRGLVQLRPFQSLESTSVQLSALHNPVSTVVPAVHWTCRLGSSRFERGLVSKLEPPVVPPRDFSLVR